MRQTPMCVVSMKMEKKGPNLAQPGVAQQRLCAGPLEGVLGHAGAHKGGELGAAGRAHLRQGHGVLHHLIRQRHVLSHFISFMHVTLSCILQRLTPQAALEQLMPDQACLMSTML